MKISFVLIISSTSNYHVNPYPKYVAIVKRLHIIRIQCGKPFRQYISRCPTNTNASSTVVDKSVINYRSVQSEWFLLFEVLFVLDSERFAVNE